jgi:hypothetical protein
LGDEQGILHIVVVIEAGESAGEYAEGHDEGDGDDGEGDQEPRPG